MNGILCSLFFKHVSACLGADMGVALLQNKRCFSQAGGKKTAKAPVVGGSIQRDILCSFCCKGDACGMGAIEMMVGPGTKASDLTYARVADQKDPWEEARQIGRLMDERLK